MLIDIALCGKRLLINLNKDYKIRYIKVLLDINSKLNLNLDISYEKLSVEASI